VNKLTFFFVNNLITGIESRKIMGPESGNRVCDQGVQLPGLCDLNKCAAAVRQTYGTKIISCACKDTAIKAAFCMCKTIC
jgi:hypothetical protein